MPAHTTSEYVQFVGMTEGELVTYLLERGLLSAECITNGSLRVTGTGGRNSTFRVTTASGPAYLVKEYRADDGSSRREAALYSYLRRHSDIDLHSHVPAVRHDDPQSGVLVLEHIEGDDLRHLCARGRPPAAAARTAIVLADLHRLSATDLPTELYEPWIMETQFRSVFIARTTGSSSSTAAHRWKSSLCSRQTASSALPSTG